MLCGITCLKMVCKYYGAFYSIEFLSSLCKEGREGISLLAMSKGADSLGLKNECGLAEIAELKNSLPCILHWNQNHFVVLYKREPDLSSMQLFCFYQLSLCSFLASLATDCMQ